MWSIPLSLPLSPGFVCFCFSSSAVFILRSIFSITILRNPFWVQIWPSHICYTHSRIMYDKFVVAIITSFTFRIFIVFTYFISFKHRKTDWEMWYSDISPLFPFWRPHTTPSYFWPSATLLSNLVLICSLLRLVDFKWISYTKIWLRKSYIWNFEHMKTKAVNFLFILFAGVNTFPTCKFIYFLLNLWWFWSEHGFDYPLSLQPLGILANKNKWNRKVTIANATAGRSYLVSRVCLPHHVHVLCL